MPRPDRHVHRGERATAGRAGADAVARGKEAALGGGQQREARFGEAHAARRSLEERSTELLFELLDARPNAAGVSATERAAALKLSNLAAAVKHRRESIEGSMGGAFRPPGYT